MLWGTDALAAAGDFNGVPCSSKLTNCYANIFLSKLETEKNLNGPFHDKIASWQRFVDDVFILWMGTEDELTMFEEFINNIHPLLKSNIGVLLGHEGGKNRQ